MLLALSTAQKFSTGSITFLLGILITFIVLAMLVVFVMLMDYFNKIDFSKLFRKKEKQLEIIEDAPEVSKDEEISKETLAAIDAAVKIYMTKSYETPHERYIIRSVKKNAKEDM
jgi:Na+-transporting methylmalonyl-CoA/oxaloacetate decarboxylase gamma subunit